jgi:hypothetical protein
MSDDHHHHVGLSRREMERELEWMMQRPPTDAIQLAKLVGRIVITLIDKNNAALAKRLEALDDGKPGAP